MITVEYLIFNDKKEKICTDRKSFESLIQTDSNVAIFENKIKYKDDLEADYYLEVGEIANSSNTYFNITISISTDDYIDKLTDLLRSFKKRFHILTDSPQVLVDGVSQYYACKAYPLIYEIENLMRKLLTKFMLINVGVDWHTTSVPDDVAGSIKNKDSNRAQEPTYLHNVDFIQLQNFLFSEKYIANRDKLLDLLKKSKDLNDLDLEKLKSLIPTSNWSKYFSISININEKQLSSDWEKLYKLRCKIAHNRSFDKKDYDSLVALIEKIKPIITKAIASLQSLIIDSDDKGSIEEKIIGSLNLELGNFISSWNKLENIIYEWVEQNHANILNDKHRNTRNLIIKMMNNNMIENSSYFKLRELEHKRNLVVHFSKEFSEKEIVELTKDAEHMIIKLNESIGSKLKIF